jgi:hypothetical protein
MKATPQRVVFHLINSNLAQFNQCLTITLLKFYSC